MRFQQNRKRKVLNNMRNDQGIFDVKFTRREVTIGYFVEAVALAYDGTK